MCYVVSKENSTKGGEKDFYYKTFLYYVFFMLHYLMIGWLKVDGNDGNSSNNGIEIRNHVQRRKKYN